MLSNIKELLNDPDVTHQETLQPLWSGYGDISRYYSPKLAASVIVKSVNPPQQVNHPRGWHSNVSHQRKLTSYTIEANFYQNYAINCNQNCYVPQLIALTSQKLNSQANLPKETQILIIEDLVHLGFDDQESTLTIHDIKTVIAWLANFHARFLHCRADDLWPIGTYWHLATRQDEFTCMQSGPLKHAALAIDNELNNAKYQTLVHGDAKLANFCFGKIKEGNDSESKSKRVAAVDFQYVGKGVGVKDLAYFLGSCLTDDDLSALHKELVDFYFTSLKKACTHLDKNINFTALESEWRKLYCFANADFLRFLQGWSPEHHKINTYLHKQTQIALRTLS